MSYLHHRECSGTMKPSADFNAKQDAQDLKQAMKGAGTNKKAIINILCKRSNAERQKIREEYKTLYGESLIKELKKELSGDLENLIIGLMYSPAEYDARILRKAIQGLGTKESALIEILASRTNSEIADIKHQYYRLFGIELEEDIQSDTSGDFEKLLVSLCQGKRDENDYANVQQAKADATALYQAGEAKLGTEESTFNSIIATQSRSQLCMVFAEYGKVSGHDIVEAINREFSGDIKQAYLAIIQCMRNRSEYFADILYKAMKGAGTDDETLIRVIVSRSERDLVQVKAKFYEKYHKSLEEWLKSETSGSYKEGLVMIINGN